ncbi:MAG: hypothetical protein JW982_10375 [Spirochaetes bacterium]|nr:hypothetical protein [Spirochaetota bacterium]
MKKIILSVIILLAGVQVLSAQSVSSFPGKENWKTIETPHFRIHYTEGLKVHAMKLTDITEKYYDILTRREKWKPAAKTDVILMDVTDFSNGYSTPFPENKVVMYLSRPQPHDTIGNFDEWLTLLFIHEYTHVLDIDMINGIPACGRVVFGRIIVPNIIQPIFIIEGNAVLNESYLTGKGRLNSNYTEMIMRTEFEDGNAKSLAQASTYPYEWPAGNIPYLYGAYFNQYLLQTRKKSFNRIFNANSNNVLPFLNFMNSYDVYGTSFPALYDEWKKAMYSRFDAQREKIREIPLTAYSNITGSGYKNSLPVFSEDGKSVFYVQYDGKDHAAIFRYDMESEKAVKLKNVSDPGSLSVDNGSVIYNDYRIYSNRYTYYDLFELNSGKSRQLTKKARIIYADRKAGLTAQISADKDLYSLKVERGDNSIFEIINSQIQMFYCKISPDGKKLVFGYRKPSGATVLAVADLPTGNILVIEDEKSFTIYPAWASDNRIIVSSDRSGVYNLYEIDLARKTMNRLTNTQTGFFESSVSSDGEKIAAVSYSRKGYDVVLIDYPEKPLTSESLPVEPLPVSYFTSQLQDEPDIAAADKNYNPFPHLIPSIWFPVLWGQAFGDDVYNSAQLFFYGQDPLEFHTYQVTGGYVFGLENSFIDVSYTYSRYVPEISILYMNNNIFTSDEIDWTYNKEKENDFSLSSFTGMQFSFPLIKNSFYSSLNLYGIYEKTSDYYLHVDETYDEIERTESYLGASILFSNASYFPYSVSKEKGMDLQFDVIYSSEMINSDSESIILTVFSDFYIPFFFKNHTLKLSISGGSIIGEDSTDTFSLGSSYFYSASLESLSAHGMRGYESSEAEGLNMTETSLGYYLPLIRKEGGCGTFPLMFSKLYLVPYFTAGEVFTDGSDFNAGNIRKTAGIELFADFAAGYFLPLSFYVGYARGFDDEGQDSWYFGIQGVFEITEKSKIIVK